jgi:hypothetical protein
LEQKVEKYLQNKDEEEFPDEAMTELWEDYVNCIDMVQGKGSKSNFLIKLKFLIIKIKILDPKKRPTKPASGMSRYLSTSCKAFRLSLRHGCGSALYVAPWRRADLAQLAGNALSPQNSVRQASIFRNTVSKFRPDFFNDCTWSTQN